jgi:outer membrane protein assembly factor BamA
LEDAGAYVGIDTTNQILGQVYITLADQYGDRRIQLYLDSVDTFANFLASYYNLEPRLQWGITLYDSRSYYVTGYDPLRERVTEKQQLYRFSTAQFNLQYPLNTYYRLMADVGYLMRDYDQPVDFDPTTGQIVTQSTENQSPYVGVGVAGDTTFWKPWGPHNGTRWEASYYYAYDMDDGGALTRNVEFDGRAYIPLSQRNELAFRLWFGWADGNQPWIYSFGGFDTLRGYPTYSLSGNRASFANIEWRFPLVDRMDLAFMRIGGIRGRVFLDVGAAWFESADGRQFNMFGQQGFTFQRDGVLIDGVSSYGFGFDVYLFGLPLHWDWVKLWNFDTSLTGWETDFWIGVRF